MPLLSLHSPLGDLSVAEDDGRIVAVDWGWGSEQESTELLAEAKRQLDAYFDGRLRAFSLPLAPVGTDFQQRIRAALQDIAYGATITYGEIAATARTSPRAVGVACGANPLPLIIPCHRVVAAGGHPGGYSGDGGAETKRALLRLEGAPGFEPELFPA